MNSFFTGSAGKPHASHQAHAMVEENSSSQSLLDRFLKNVVKAFSFLTDPHPQSNENSNRRDLRDRAKSLVSELVIVKEELATKVDPKLFKYIEVAIDFLVKDYGRISTLLNSEHSIGQHSQICKKVCQWIEKSKIWLKLPLHVDDAEAIKQFVLQSMSSDSLSLIDRDIELLHEYQKHAIESLELDESTKSEVQELLVQKLYPFVNSLRQLQEHPHDYSLEQFQIRKEEIDRHREKLFNGGLQLIDTVVSFHANQDEAIFEVEGYEHLADVFDEIASLEKKACELTEKNKRRKVVDEQTKVEITQINSRVHSLYLDMQVPQAAADKLKDIKVRVDALGKSFGFGKSQ